MSTPETRYNNPSVDLKMNSNPVKESEPQNSQSINGNIISINKSKNSDSTNGSSTNNNNSSHKEIIDKEKDEERRIRVIKELEEKREIKEKEIKKEKERIRKALLKVTSIVTNKNGLNNLGNTCYMNTCLQLLIHCSPFLDKLFTEVPTEKLSKEFYNLCNEQLLECTSPINLKNIFSIKHKLYKGSRQHDTQEFCRLFLEDISNEMNKVKIIPPYIELDNYGKSKIQLNYEYDKIFKRRENSIVVDTFYGQTINIFKCKCGYESYSYQKFLDVPLLFVGKGNQKLNVLLEKFFEGDDKIEWGIDCENCFKKQLHKKIVKIAYPPEILILSLQRYNSKTNTKNNAEVNFSETIDLKKFADKDCCGEFSTKYHLIGVGNHYGEMNFGHYYAFINIEKEWFEFNDSSCFPCEKFNKSSQTAYILVYQRE